VWFKPAHARIAAIPRVAGHSFHQDFVGNDQLWVSAENKAGEFCTVSSTVLPATVFGSLFDKVGAAVQIKINDIHRLHLQI
jgi:hypothetical protein